MQNVVAGLILTLATALSEISGKGQPLLGNACKSWKVDFWLLFFFFTRSMYCTEKKEENPIQVYSPLSPYASDF